jgi:hypothetical protein
VIKSNHITNDGLLHYAPYKVVIPPSERFYETLCVAEQGKKRDNDYQEPVYHSVIPHEIAKDFDEQKIVPEGDLQDVIISDIYSYVPVELPFDAVPKTQFFLVHHVLIKYSSDYKVHPKKGSCCLSDANYFRSCAKIMDKKWEDADIDSCVDVCLITGQPGPTDSGRNEILLCGRIYREDFSIPLLTDSRDQDLINNSFLSSCYNTISKSGFATHRVGGSSGDNGATEEQKKNTELLIYVLSRHPTWMVDPDAFLFREQLVTSQSGFRSCLRCCFRFRLRVPSLFFSGGFHLKYCSIIVR